MSIPKFSDFLMPILSYLDQVKEADYAKLISHIQKTYNISEEDIKQRRPNGKTIVYDRVAWAATFLKKAGLVERPKRGIVKITSFGKIELQKFKTENTKELNAKILSERYESFRKFHKSKAKKTENQSVLVNNKSYEVAVQENNDEKTPQENMESLYLEMNERLKGDLLEKIFNSSPFFFEKLVIDLLINLGYGGSKKEAGRAFQSTKDEGIDGMIYEDKLGLDIIYIQAKRWKSPVSRPEIQKFAGALQGKRVKKGIFITTSHFSKDAKDYVQGLDIKIRLIDGDQLTDFMIKSNTGAIVSEKYEIKKINEDYFDDVA